MRASTKRILSIGLAAFIFAAVLIFYSSLIKPVVAEVENLRSQIASKENLLNKEKQVVNQLQGFIEQVNGLSDLQKTLNLALPNNQETFQALNQYQSIARAVGLKILSVNIKEEPLRPAIQPLAKRLGTLQFNLSLSGTYEGLKAFLETLENNVRVSNVKKFQLRPAMVDTNQNSFLLDLTIDSYYQSE